MSAPKRIQRLRTKGWRMPDGAVYVGRPTRWGNPFVLATRNALACEPGPVTRLDWEHEDRISADGLRHDYHHEGGAVTVCHVRYLTRAETVELYREVLTGGMRHIRDPRWFRIGPREDPVTVTEVRERLAGRDLACWCPTYEPCHADVLLEIANGGDPS